MIHITAEIGKPGKKEREKLHFPDIHNQPSIIHTPKAKGRKYIPHQVEGREEEWRPHNQNINIIYSDSGPDWSSKLKYIPASIDLNYPAAEIWPNNWKAMRPYPFTYKRSDKEWLLDPGLTRLGLRCLFDGVHKASATSSIDHPLVYGCRRNENIVDKRNSLNEASPGDKSYQVSEYSPDFYKSSYTDTKPRFRSGNSPYMSHHKFRADTFIPLVPLPPFKRKTFREKMVQKQIQQEVDEVKKLEVWQPAPPISTKVPQLDQSELKKY